MIIHFTSVEPKIQIRMYDFSAQWTTWDVGTILNFIVDYFWKVTSLLSYFHIRKRVHECTKYLIFNSDLMQRNQDAFSIWWWNEKLQSQEDDRLPPPPLGSGRVEVRPEVTRNPANNILSVTQTLGRSR
jgi:hypothetical protein